MSRKQRKAAKRRAIRKARKREIPAAKKTPKSEMYSRCDSCDAEIPSDEPARGWVFTARQGLPVYVTCPDCLPPQEEALTWNDWDEF